MLILDLDADGLVERVKSFGIGASDRWELKRFRPVDAEGDTSSIRPLLLTRVEDGIGGVTHLQHAPSSRFVPPPAVAPRLPFVTWLVTGIRRTDGLCDVEPTDWFTLAGNPCLADGHELVERFEYEDGAYDGLGREFLGFAKTRVFEGPAETGSLRELEFHQSHALKGRIARESILAGGVDLLSRTTSTWRTYADGPRTQIQLEEERVETFALYPQFGGGANACVVHRNSIRHPDGRVDPQSRIQTTCSMACAGAGSADQLCEPSVPGKKQIETTWADPISGATSPVWDRPAQIVTRHVDATGALQTAAMIRHAYDGLPYGATDRGRVTSEQSTIEVGPDRHAFKVFAYDAGQPVGPGNLTSILVPVTGQSRAPRTIEFDDEFALHPVRETASVSNTGAAAERRIESRYDLRFGKRSETVGLHGRGAGDVSGTVFDGLGRPVCEYAPGTACGATSGFGASLEYRYAYGDPAASDPLARLSSVEVRRREPNAPGGHLVTRSWFDALGRERLTTNQQNVADPPASPRRPALETVVARHLEYGPNGKAVRAFAPWVAPGGTPTLSPPAGAARSETSYVLNGNPAGRLDPAGRPFEVVAYDGSRSRTYFFGDTLRRIDAISATGSGGHHTVETFDAHGRPIERRSLQGASTLLARWNAAYDGRDRLVAEWFGGSLTTLVERRYDLLGRAVETVDPDAGRWRIRYDEAGNEIFRDDPKANESIQSCYDGLDRVVLQCVRASDTPDPSLCGQAQPACVMAYRYRYDEATPVLATDNRGLGHLTTVEGPDGRHRYAYDVRGRMILSVDEIHGDAGATRFHYAPDHDRLEAMTYPDGEIVRYGYDASGQAAALHQVDASGQPLAAYVREVVYDLRGRPLSIERGNLTADRFEYHGAAEGFALARLTSRSMAATALDPRLVYSDLDYRDYDANGRLLRIDDRRDPSGPLSMTASYAYDGAGRLTGVIGPQPESFVYDSIGNLRSIDGSAFAQTSGGGSPLGPHQFDRLGNPSTTHWTMTWDENGRRTGKRRSDGGVVQTYAYDAFGSLRALVVNGALTQMGYDHTGRRVLESRDGVVRRVFGRHAERVNGELVKYYYLGDRLIATRSDPPPTTGAGAGADGGLEPNALAGFFDAAPIRLAVVVMGGLLLLVPVGRARPALGLRIARSNALGGSFLVFAISLPIVVTSVGCAEQAVIRHYHLDHLGTPVAITGPGGALERQYRHSVYGKMRRFDGEGRASGADATNRREFTGYQTDEASGLQYAGSRFYDPDQASFLTPDPADEHASPYAYVGWDPVNAVDPNGAELTLVAAILLAISAVLVVASAIVAGVQSGSAAVGFKALGIGVAGLAAGYVVGLAAPAAASASLISQTSAAAINSTLSVAAIGASVYGMTGAEGTSNRILAGAGLAVSLAGAAYSIGSLGRARGGASSGATSGASAAGSGGAPAMHSGEIVRTAQLSPSTAQRLALEAQRRMVQIAQFTALAKVKSEIAEIRAQFFGQKGIDVYADVLIEGPRIPHPTRLFAEYLLPNKIEVAPVVVPTGRGPTPTWMAPVPWDRFRIHEFVPVLQNGAAPKMN